MNPQHALSPDPLGNSPDAQNHAIDRHSQLHMSQRPGFEILPSPQGTTCQAKVDHVAAHPRPHVLKGSRGQVHVKTIGGAPIPLANRRTALWARFTMSQRSPQHGRPPVIAPNTPSLLPSADLRFPMRRKITPPNCRRAVTCSSRDRCRSRPQTGRSRRAMLCLHSLGPRTPASPHQLLQSVEWANPNELQRR